VELTDNLNAQHCMKRLLTALVLIATVCTCLGVGFPYIITPGGSGSNITLYSPTLNNASNSGDLHIGGSYYGDASHLAGFPGIGLTNGQTNVSLTFSDGG